MIEKPQPHRDPLIWTRPGLPPRMYPHRHLLWVHQRHSTPNIDHTARVIIARNWFLYNVWPAPLVMLLWKYGWPRGRKSHWAIRLAERIMPEGMEYRWRNFFLLP